MPSPLLSMAPYPPPLPSSWLSRVPTMTSLPPMACPQTSLQTPWMRLWLSTVLRITTPVMWQRGLQRPLGKQTGQVSRTTRSSPGTSQSTGARETGRQREGEEQCAPHARGHPEAIHACAGEGEMTGPGHRSATVRPRNSQLRETAGFCRQDIQGQARGWKGLLQSVSVKSAMATITAGKLNKAL